MAMSLKGFTKEISVFRGLRCPETALLVGYGAVIEKFQLPVPLPDRLSLISYKRRSYTEKEWIVFSSRAKFEDTLYKHLVFSLKYEGINLLIFKKLFEEIAEEEIVSLLKQEPTGQYSRRIWFLYEWLMGKKLDIPDLTIKNYVPLVDDNLQFALVAGQRSHRHRIVNNLPGTRDFCPLIRKTEKLDKYLSSDIANQTNQYLKQIHKDVLQRASSFLLLKDSKASFTIEGEIPKSKRASRWGRAIGQAGNNEFSKQEILRLQQIIIENPRFIEIGFRNKGGFVGEHDRITGEPIPEHISARWEDLDQLMDGLLSCNKLLQSTEFNAVLAATVIAFGFVFIHPLEDGNGRLHRYLIHDVLAKKEVTPQGIIFPLSASILDHIGDYRKVLLHYSEPLLDFIDWKETADHNLEVRNKTIDYYRYFDATRQAAFLFDSIKDTVDRIIPQEIDFLRKYDQFKSYLDDTYEMPNHLVDLLILFLEQNHGELSKRSREKEFALLGPGEIQDIEAHFQEIFQ